MIWITLLFSATVISFLLAVAYAYFEGYEDGWEDRWPDNGSGWFLDPRTTPR